MKKKISERQKQFVREFVKRGNKTQAYLAVYKNVKDATVARSAAARLMKDENVREHYNQLIAEIDDEQIASVREVLIKYTEILRGEATDYSVYEGEVIEVPPKVGDVMRAGGELLKRLDMNKAQDSAQEAYGVIMMPEVYEEEGG